MNPANPSGRTVPPLRSSTVRSLRPARTSRNPRTAGSAGPLRRSPDHYAIGPPKERGPKKTGVTTMSEVAKVPTPHRQTAMLSR